MAVEEVQYVETIENPGAENTQAGNEDEVQSVRETEVENAETTKEPEVQNSETVEETEAEITVNETAKVTKKPTKSTNSAKKNLNWPYCDIIATKLSELTLHIKTMHKTTQSEFKKCTECEGIVWFTETASINQSINRILL